jgi:hypothetical protein
LLTAMLALCCAAMTHAQFVDASAAGEPVKLTAPWRHHAGDDPVWAAPGFDDSQWQLISPEENVQQKGHPATSPYGWYRIRVKLPAAPEPLALIMGPVSCEVYADGSLVGIVGVPQPDEPRTWRAIDAVNVLPLPPGLNGRTITLAVRVAYRDMGFRTLFWPGYVSSVAPARLQWQQREADSNNTLLQNAPAFFSNAVWLCMGLFSLGLYLLRPRSAEYGWAALSFLMNPVSGVLVLYLRLHQARGCSIDSVNDGLLAVYLLATAMFIWRFIGARRGGLFRAAMVVNVVEITVALLEVNYVFGRSGLTTIVCNIVCFALLQLFVILLFVRMGISAVKGSRDAQLLCLPFTLMYSLSLLSFVTLTLSWAGVMKQWTFTALQAGQVTVSWINIFDWIASASMGMVLVLRFVRSSEREQRLTSEMETARRVQVQLVPAELPATEHFRFEAAYRSASEVGGDLYQVYPRADGSVMVLVGDVSGKGLKAAMMGTLVVGAAGTLAQEEPAPAEMLSRLNRRLCGSSDGGFVTCLCCLIAPDGRLILSNAGHLAPYRNGQEVDCASGLPLGLVAGAEYSETELQLGESDTLTFLSDGVVEARNAQGELFGFARAQAISAEPAQKIAAQAVAFGQEDDITVLTLTLSPSWSVV